MKNEHWKLIAGRGEPGDTNWGTAERSLKTLNRELMELKKHIGEEILLTGGGGPGRHLAVLQKAWIKPRNNYYNLRVKLTKLDPALAGMKTFEPYIDSWQISVIDKEEH